MSLKPKKTPKKMSDKAFWALARKEHFAEKVAWAKSDLRRGLKLSRPTGKTEWDKFMRDVNRAARKEIAAEEKKKKSKRRK